MIVDIQTVDIYDSRYMTVDINIYDYTVEYNVWSGRYPAQFCPAQFSDRTNFPVRWTSDG